MSRGISETEPWLRGPIPDVHPLLAPVLYCFQQTREDLEHWTAGLSNEEIWRSKEGFASVGFQLRHIAGSIDRLMTYVAGGQLNEAQLNALRAEHEPGESREALMRGLNATLAAAEETVRRINPGSLVEPREVGRKKLPSTTGGLLIHIAEHTQRHVGQAIITAKLVRAGLI
jgi:uncharacterized damage-inducible protein DinB